MTRRRKPLKFRQDLAGPKLRVVGTVREEAGWRIVSADIPAELVRQYEVKNYEPDLKQMAQERALQELWGKL